MRFSVFILFSLALSVQISGQTIGKQNIILTSDDWCPFVCTDKSAPGPGLLIEILNAAFKDSKFNVEYRTMGWERSLQMVNQGQLNGLVGAYRSDSQGLQVTQESFYQTQDCFFGHKDRKIKVQKPTDLLNLKVGLVGGYALYDEWAEFQKTPQGESVFVSIAGDDAFSQMVERTHAKRLDLFFENRDVVQFKSRTNDKAKVIESKGCSRNQDVFVPFSNHPKMKDLNAQIVSHLDGFLKSSRFQAQLKELKRKYHLK